MNILYLQKRICVTSSTEILQLTLFKQRNHVGRETCPEPNWCTQIPVFVMWVKSKMLRFDERLPSLG